MSNLVSHNLRDRGSTAVLANNLENASLTLFVDGANGDQPSPITDLTEPTRAYTLTGLSNLETAS